MFRCAGESSNPNEACNRGNSDGANDIHWAKRNCRLKEARRRLRSVSEMREMNTLKEMRREYENGGGDDEKEGIEEMG